jgi:predicted sulfurtransferase
MGNQYVRNREILFSRQILTASLQEEGKDVAGDKNLGDPLVFDQGVALRAGSGDKAPKGHVNCRCEQCLQEKLRSVSQKHPFEDFCRTTDRRNQQ